MQWTGEVDAGEKRVPSAKSQAIRNLIEGACQSTARTLLLPRPEGAKTLTVVAQLSPKWASEIGVDEEFMVSVDVPVTA